MHSYGRRPPILSMTASILSVGRRMQRSLNVSIAQSSSRALPLAATSTSMVTRPCHPRGRVLQLGPTSSHDRSLIRMQRSLRKLPAARSGSPRSVTACCRKGETAMQQKALGLAAQLLLQQWREQGSIPSSRAGKDNTLDQMRLMPLQ